MIDDGDNEAHVLRVGGEADEESARLLVAKQLEGGVLVEVAVEPGPREDVGHALKDTHGRLRVEGTKETEEQTKPLHRYHFLLVHLLHCNVR